MKNIILLKTSDYADYEVCLFVENEIEELRLTKGDIIAAIESSNSCVVKTEFNHLRKILEACLRDENVNGVIVTL